MDLQKGTILGMSGSWGSGIATLSLQVSDGMKINVLCENGQTVRALNACFGNVISPGHRINMDAIRGKEIYFSIDDMGMLEGFSPVEADEMEVEQ